MQLFSWTFERYLSPDKFALFKMPAYVLHVVTDYLFSKKKKKLYTTLGIDLHMAVDSVHLI